MAILSVFYKKDRGFVKMMENLRLLSNLEVILDEMEVEINCE